MTVISISIPDNLLKELGDSIRERGFASRSEIVRQAVRAFTAEYRSLQELEGEILATITIITGKRANRDRILETQHQFGNVVSTFLHSHVDEEYCLEVIVARGDADVIRRLVDALKADEQIAQVKIAVLGKPRSRK